MQRYLCSENAWPPLLTEPSAVGESEVEGRPHRVPPQHQGHSRDARGLG